MLFNLGNDRFPVGVNVSAYLAAREWPGAATPPPTQAPKSTPADTEAMGSSGLTFHGLEPDTAYWAVGQVDGAYRWVRFKTGPSQTAVYITEDPEDWPFEIETPAALAVSAFRIRKGPTTIFEIDQNGFLTAGAMVASDLTVWEGGDPSGVSDSAGSLQTLLDHLHSTYAARGVRGDTIIVPGGSFKLASEVTYYQESGYAQSIVGQGQASTRFFGAADLGRNKYMFRPSNSRSGLGKNYLGKFTLRGNPAAATEWDMHGLALASGGTAEDIYCEGGFRGGLVALNDHTNWLNCESHGSRFNLYFGYQHNAKDNHIIQGGNYTDGLLACFGIAGNNALGGTLMTGFHIGVSPYCFYKEDPADTANFDTFNAEPINAGLNAFFGGNELIGIRFENTGTSFFHAENPGFGASCDGNIFIHCQQGGAQYSTNPFVDGFSVSQFLHNTFICSETLLVAYNGGKYVNANGGQVYGNRVILQDQMSGTLVAEDLDDYGGSGWRFESPIGEVFIASRCDANVNAGDVLMGWVGGFGGTVKPFDAATASAVAGVSRDTVLSGGHAMVQLRGYCNRVNVIDASAPDSQKYLVATTTNGKATHVPAGVAATARPFARALSGNFGGAGAGWCQAELFVA